MVLFKVYRSEPKSSRGDVLGNMPLFRIRSKKPNQNQISLLLCIHLRTGFKFTLGDGPFLRITIAWNVTQQNFSLLAFVNKEDFWWLTAKLFCLCGVENRLMSLFIKVEIWWITISIGFLKRFHDSKSVVKLLTHEDIIFGCECHIVIKHSYTSKSVKTWIATLQQTLAKMKSYAV